MSPLGVLSYLSGAAVYALFPAVIAFVALRRRPLGQRCAGTALVLITAFLVMLGLHPFPDPARLDCTDGGAALLLRPLRFIDAYWLYWQEGRPAADWLRSLDILAPVANLVFFAVAGAVLATLTRRVGLAALYGLAVSSFIELSQLTALYGIYPCRYRHFETDDFILNIAGVLLGFVLMRRVRRQFFRT